MKKRNWTPDWFLKSVLDMHINAMVNRYSCLRVIRQDLFYQKNTFKYHHPDHQQMESDVRHLMDEMMNMPVVVGYFWVIEWTEDHLFHAHVAFWLDGNKTQKPFFWMEKAGACWREITENDGCYYRCEHKPNYEADINIPVRYSDSGSISNMRDVLEYMTKIEQKNALLMYGCNEVPERPLTGRPRSNSTLI
ncbi:inovirus-type Gp2 protein [Klebsiella pneumoniae]|nr:inovirus-type Gp2 protein [Klebsiella pneumoniae]